MTVKRTRLCYWIARPVKPGVQSSNTSRVRFTVISHTPVRSRFYHIHILHKRNWDGFWLMNLTQKCFIFFKFAICSIALLSLGERCHIKGRDMVTVWRTLMLLSCYDCDSTHQHYDVTRFKKVLRRRTMHEWVMKMHYQGRFINMIRTPSKQWGACDKHKYKSYDHRVTPVSTRMVYDVWYTSDASKSTFTRSGNKTRSSCMPKLNVYERVCMFYLMYSMVSQQLLWLTERRVLITW